MFIVMLLRRVERIRERNRPLGLWGALWLLIVLRLALVEFGIICFWAPLFIATYDQADRTRKQRRLRRRKPGQDRTGREVDSEN